VPSLGAGLFACIAGWLLDELLQPLLGTGVTLALSFVGSTLAFYYARQWLRDLRGD
jgi:uncharacterized membrane protein YdjX (TVP38/TMEM64 family)